MGTETTRRVECDWPRYLKMDAFTRERRFLLIDDGRERYDLWRVIGVRRGPLVASSTLIFGTGVEVRVSLEYEIVSDAWQGALEEQAAQ